MNDIIISGDSMTPTLSHGEKVSVSIKDSYCKGDLICFYLPGTQDFIIHRIVKIYRDIVYTCGDNRLIPDIGVKQSSISGKVEYKYRDNQHLSVAPFKRFILTAIFIQFYVWIRVFRRSYSS